VRTLLLFVPNDGTVLLFVPNDGTVLLEFVITANSQEALDFGDDCLW
jgi:hypothetical protein